MSRRINEKFLNHYMELDKVCLQKFGVATGGVTEYINRLNSARFAPGRDDVLPRLVRYRNLRNKFAHEVGALRRVDEISKADIRWIKGFHHELVRKRDPISAYLKKARKYARRKKIRRVLYGVLSVALIGLAVALYFVISGNM